MSPAWRGVVARAAGPPPSRRTRPARRSQVASYHLSNAAAPYVPPPLRACPTDATSRRPGDVLFSVHLDQLKEVRHCQRPNEETEQAQVRNSHERPDQGHQWMDVGPSPGHHRPDHVIDIPDNQNPP